MPINDVQTTNRQHAVPQNIMDVEFKIIGGLTMRQFAYLAIFGGMAYGSFIYVNVPLLKPLLIILFVFLGLAFAFLPIEERGLDEWLINFVRAMYKDNQLIWRKESEIPQAFSFENIDMVKQELITLTPTSSRRKLEEYLDRQDFRAEEDPLDIAEFEYIDKLRTAFSYASTTNVQPTTPNNSDNEIVRSGVNQHKTNIEQHSSEDDKNIQNQTQKKVQKTETQIQKPEEPVVRRKLLGDENQMQRPSGQKYRPMRTVTPDRHSGRKFTNLLPKQGEIVLPIRGERMLRTTEEEKIQADIQDKANQLKRLLSQIKEDEQLITERSVNVQVPSELKQNVAQAKATTEEIKQQLEEAKNLPPIKNELSGDQNNLNNDTNVEAPRPNEQNNEVPTQENKPVQEDQQEQKPQMPATPTIGKPQTTNQGVLATTANIQPLADKPNIISGIVRDPSGEALPGVVLIVKNDKEEPVRALKSNQLGHFAISTPLSNGSYMIETDKSKKTGFSFDIINFETTGVVLPPVEIKGK